MPCDHSVRVTVDERKFVVEFGPDGDVLRIKERMTLVTFGVDHAYLTSYWVASSHSLGKKNTMPKRIIAAAREKMAAEDRASAATPR